MHGGSHGGGASGCRLWESGEQCNRAVGVPLQVRHEVEVRREVVGLQAAWVRLEVR